MKLIIYTLLAFMLASNLSFSQDKASPQTLLHLFKFENDKNYQKQYSTKQLSALIKVNSSINEAELELRNIKIRTRAGNIYTIGFSSNELAYLLDCKGIDYIQLDEPIMSLLDSARSGIGAGNVQSGYELNTSGFTGKNVIIGIVDSGFDYAHPVFYDSVSNRLRITKVWEQRKEGNPPANFGYGNELLTDEEIYQSKTDVTTSSHGTHVASIAAGNGNLTNNRLIGMAPDAELVFVGIRPEPEEWKNSGMSSLVDAFKYIFDYADSQGKPVVANLSWGIAIGPRDGSSLFNQACNNLIKPGRAITISAGNSGRDDLHFNHKFSEQDTIFHTFLEFNPYFDKKYTWVDSWTEKDNIFELSFKLYNKEQKTYSTNVLTVDTEQSSMGSISLLNSNGDSCVINYVINKIDFNGKTRLFFEVENYSNDYVMISGQGKKGELHIWSGIVHQYRGYPSTFVNLLLPWAKDGNRKYVVNDLSTADSVFSCAAYTTKNRWTNIDGQKHNYSEYARNYIALFSSNGPSLSGAIKPDFAAPGAFLEAAVSSYDQDFELEGDSRYMLTEQYPIDGERYYRFAALAGTSMAAPATAGSIALMFEAEPNLSTAQIRKLIEKTALKNMYYSTPDIWGVGILQIHQAMKSLLGITSVDEPNFNSGIEIISQSPDILNYKIDKKNLSELTLHVYDLNGRLIMSNAVNNISAEGSLNISNLTNGVYILRLFNSQNNFKCKFVK